LTHGIIDQILRAPVTVLIGAEQNDSLAMIETVHRIFDLSPKDL